MEKQKSQSRPFRLPVALVLGGQLLYIAVTQFHAGGDANRHHTIFSTYAHDSIWSPIHLLQFAGMALLLSGLFGLFYVVGTQPGTWKWTTRVGGAVTAAALALYGALQAVDGVALKHAVTAWTVAPDAEKPARFATAEALRWLEWGMRTYHDIAFGTALLLLAAAVIRSGLLARPMAYVIGASGVAYLMQGWLLGSDGFSPMHSAGIVTGWGLSLVWMIWLTLEARTIESLSAPPSASRASSIDNRRQAVS